MSTVKGAFDKLKRQRRPYHGNERNAERKAEKRKGKNKRKERRICKCECGGIVRGAERFGRLWTWCDICTPVVKVTIPFVPLKEWGQR